MKKYAVWAALALFFMLGLRLMPGFAQLWGGWVSRPMLRGLSWIGDRAPFSLLEWGALALGAFLCLSLFLRRLLRCLLCALLGLFTLFLCAWYPLYFDAVPQFSARPEQLAATAMELIAELNACETDFSVLPELPAKPARFPGWMDALGIAGFASFFTGEAVVSPTLPACTLPFVAVHERMHLLGYADEGAANIAAWEDCMARGGAFAASARLWALRCAMGMLRKESPPLYEACMDRMNPRCLQLYREAGGAWSPAQPSPAVSAFLDILGIRRQLSSYENLAAYLATWPG